MDRDLSPFANHRAAFLALLAEEDAAAVVPTSRILVRNGDTEHRFRPDSDFYYLTGFAEPESVLVLLPDGPGRDGSGPKSVLFLRERNAREEVWTGRRLGTEAACEKLGIDAAHATPVLPESLAPMLEGYPRILYRLGADEGRDREWVRVLNRLRKRSRMRGGPAPEVVDPAPLLHELRLTKDAHEIATMKRAAEISAEAHIAAMAEARPGLSECAIDALLEYTFRRRGGTGSSYTNIVAGGANACILHYVENDAPLVDGELLLVDAGAEVGYYASDVTRTYPVNGEFTTLQRALYECVLGAQLAAIDAVRPGATFDAPHEAALQTLVESAIELGLIEGPLDEALAEKRIAPYYMHRTSHWLGLDVHDCGAYEIDGAPRALEPGMVLTIEPGLYLPPDDEKLEARFRGIGIRIEDDVLVTETGHEVLTAAVPKTIEEIEAACRGDLRAWAKTSRGQGVPS